MSTFLYAEIYVTCLIITGLIYFWIKRKTYDSITELWLRRLCLCFFLNNAVNLLFTVFNQIYIIPSAVLFLSYALKTAYFITLITGVFCWCAYAEVVLYGEIKKTRSAGRLFQCGLIIAAYSIPIINLFTHWMFDFTESYAYSRHALFRVEMWCLFFAALVDGYHIVRQSVREKDAAKKEFLNILAAFPVALLAACLLTYLGENYPVICVAITIELMCLYIGSIQARVSIDPLTQLNNRQHLISFLTGKLEHHTKDVYVLMLDLDYFKEINDNYGHQEGDRALIQLSGVLKQSCESCQPHPFIARYGGDEFIIIMEGEEETVTALADRIHASLDQINEKNPKYEILVSIGCVRWEPSMEAEELIKAADTNMYQVKAERKRARETKNEKMSEKMKKSQKIY